MVDLKCTNDDCSYKTDCIAPYYSKLIGDDGYPYCRQCAIEKQLLEEQQIKLLINDYEFYIKNKTDKRFENKDDIPLSLDQAIKHRYLHKYITHQIPKHSETVIRDEIEYSLIETSVLLELEVLLSKKHVIYTKVIAKKQEIARKQATIILEDEMEELLERKEKWKEEVKQRPNKDRVRRKKKEVEISIAFKEEKLEKYKKERLPEGFTKRDIKKCDYCKNHYCHPFEFMITIKEEKRRKCWKGIICDYCVEVKETEKANKRVECPCGGSYYNITEDYERRHHNTKKHCEWHKIYKMNKMREKEFYTYKLDDLRKLVSKNNEALGKVIINNCHKLKKDQLLKALVELDKQKLLPIDKISKVAVES